MNDTLDFVHGVDLGLGNLAPGRISMANAARFDSAFYDQPLTNYTVGGWDRDPLMEILEFYAPACSVTERFTYKEANILEHFLRLEGDEDIRAMGGQYGRVDTGRMTEVHDQLDEKGLVVSVDRRELEENPMAAEQATDRVRRILLRNELRRAIALHVASSVNTAKTWDTTAGKDPDQDVSTEGVTAATLGLRFNRVGYGSVAWSKRQLAIRAQNNAGGYASSAWSPQQLGDFLQVEAITFNEARYRGASALANYIGNLVLMFYAASGLSKEDPSHIKRFTGMMQGAQMAVFRQEFPRHVEISVGHKSKIKATSTLAWRRFTVS